MYALKPIGAIKIGKSIFRLTVGNKVPDNVIAFWKSTKQLEDLKKSGAIGEKETGNNGNFSGENKKSEKQDNGKLI